MNIDAKFSRRISNLDLTLYKDSIQQQVYSNLDMQCEHGTEKSMNPAQYINRMKKKSTGSYQ